MVERWSFVSMGEDGVQETDYMHLKGKSITKTIQLFIFFKHRNVQLLCAFTIFHDK